MAEPDSPRTVVCFTDHLLFTIHLVSRSLRDTLAGSASEIGKDFFQNALATMPGNLVKHAG